MASPAYLAFDLGAESGRAMLGQLHDEKLVLEEAHRFANTFVNLPSGLHWNLTGLWANLLEGVGRAQELAQAQQTAITSLGVDSWGVDFALMGDAGQVLGLPFAYRDPRWAPYMQGAFDRVGREAIYGATGIQFMAINSLYQLLAYKAEQPKLLAAARRMLWMPDLLHYFFSGAMVNEWTIASTSQMTSPQHRDWAYTLLHDLELPTDLLGTLALAGTTVGPMRPDLISTLNLPGSINVVAPASHDTASAIVAVPAVGDESWCYLSCGTWSLLGVELDKPVLTDAAMAVPFTNEGGYGNTVRFLKNISGLWLVQSCRRDLEAQGQNYDYAQLAELAAASEPMRTLIDPAHPPFAVPGDMLEKIRTFARTTRQPEPQTPGQFVRCCLESLALAYRQTLDELEAVLGRSYRVMHLVGGGGRNRLLCQMTADAIERPVVVGPYEATAAGNVLVQALADGQLKDLRQARQVVARSFALETFEPTDCQRWQEARGRFARLTADQGQ